MMRKQSKENAKKNTALFSLVKENEKKNEHLLSGQIVGFYFKNVCLKIENEMWR